MSKSNSPPTTTLRSSSRRIRFAPLPDPRNDDDRLPDPAVLGEVEEGEEVAIGNDNEEVEMKSSKTTLAAGVEKISRHKEAKHRTDPSSPPPTPVTATPLSYSTSVAHNVLTNKVITPKSTALKSILRTSKKSSSFSSGSSRTLTPATSSESRSHGKNVAKGGMTKEEMVSRGIINISSGGSSGYSSCDSGYGAGNESDTGVNVTRWTLTSSASTRSAISGNGTPLARIQRTQSQPYTSRQPSAPNRPDTSLPNRNSRIQNLDPRTRGTRMLNGRVYGARNGRTNPFSNMRNDEPEFVEWGYGGIGTRSASASTSAGIDEEEDDGSGMEWVKRRRMQRERERSEREEREKREAEEKTQTEKVEEVPEDIIQESNPEHATSPEENANSYSSSPPSRRDKTNNWRESGFNDDNDTTPEDSSDLSGSFKGAHHFVISQAAFTDNSGQIYVGSGYLLAIGGAFALALNKNSGVETLDSVPQPQAITIEIKSRLSDQSYVVNVPIQSDKIQINILQDGGVSLTLGTSSQIQHSDNTEEEYSGGTKRAMGCKSALDIETGIYSSGLQSWPFASYARNFRKLSSVKSLAMWSFIFSMTIIQATTS